MDIILLVASQLELTPDLLAMVKSNVDEHGGNGSKGQSIGESKLGRQEQRRILFIRGLIEIQVVSKDSRNVVNLTEVVV